MSLYAPDRHLRFHQCEDEFTDATDCDIVLTQSAYARINHHLATDTRREHGGLLLGYIAKSSNMTPATVIIVGSLPAEFTHGTPTSLTFTEESWLKFEEQTDALKRLGLPFERLGWYHSHPGLGIFLSHWDLDVCTNFTRVHHVALVVDPIRGRGGFFPRGERGYREREPRGFWELPDLTPTSIVTWSNTREISRERMMPSFTVLPTVSPMTTDFVGDPKADESTEEITVSDETLIQETQRPTERDSTQLSEPTYHDEIPLDPGIDSQSRAKPEGNGEAEHDTPENERKNEEKVQPNDDPATDSSSALDSGEVPAGAQKQRVWKSIGSSVVTVVTLGWLRKGTRITELALDRDKTNQE